MPLMHTHSKFTTMRIVLCILLFIVSGCHKSDASLKLYVFDCGTLKSGNPAPLIERGVTTTDMSVAAYLIVHASGTLLSGYRRNPRPDDSDGRHHQFSSNCAKNIGKPTGRDRT